MAISKVTTNTVIGIVVILSVLIYSSPPHLQRLAVGDDEIADDLMGDDVAHLWRPRRCCLGPKAAVCLPAQSHRRCRRLLWQRTLVEALRVKNRRSLAEDLVKSVQSANQPTQPHPRQLPPLPPRRQWW